MSRQGRAVTRMLFSRDGTRCRGRAFEQEALEGEAQHSAHHCGIHQYTTKWFSTLLLLRNLDFFLGAVNAANTGAESAGSEVLDLHSDSPLTEADAVMGAASSSAVLSLRFIASTAISAPLCTSGSATGCAQLPAVVPVDETSS